MPRLLPIGFLLATLVASGAAARDLPRRHSWGKPDISYLQYRTDTVECAYEAATKTPLAADLSADMETPTAAPSAQSSAAGAPNIDLNDLMWQAVMSYRLQQMRVTRRVEDRLQTAIDDCLQARGYTPFVLTKAQLDDLAHLPEGARVRQRFLFRLSADPDVLKAQVARR